MNIKLNFLIPIQSQNATKEHMSLKDPPVRYFNEKK